MLSRAFDDALVAAGGSLPIWLVVTTVKGVPRTPARDIAGAIGMEDATLTHHLNRMERDGLVSRHRDPANRRNQVVELDRRRRGAVRPHADDPCRGFDTRLRAGVTGDELDQLRALLHRLRTNPATR